MAGKCGLSCCWASPFGAGRNAKEKGRQDRKPELWLSSKEDPHQWAKTCKGKLSWERRDPDISCPSETSAKWPGSAGLLPRSSVPQESQMQLLHSSCFL